MAKTQWFVFLPAVLLGLNTLPAAEAAPIDSIPDGVFVPAGTTTTTTTTTTAPTIPVGPIGPENTFVPTVGVIDEVSFPATFVGARNTVDIPISNPGENAVTVTVELEADVEFRIVDDSCANVPLEKETTCIVTISFAPENPGVFAGALSVQFDARPTGSVTFMASAVPAAASTTDPPSTDPPTTDPPTTTSPPDTTTPPTSSPPSTIPDDTDERLEQCDAQALAAEVAYAQDLEMTVGQATAVTVSVAVGGAPLPSPTNDDSTPSTTIEPAQLSCFLTAELSGTNFQIDSPRQSGDFFRSPVLTWTWQVTPLNTGAHTLTLRITPQIDVNGSTRDGTPRPFTSQINVTPVEQGLWADFTDLVESIVGYPLISGVPAIGTFAVALIAFWTWARKQTWSRFRRPHPENVDDAVVTETVDDT